MLTPLIKFPDPWIGRIALFFCSVWVRSSIALNHWGGGPLRFPIRPRARSALSISSLSARSSARILLVHMVLGGLW